MLKEEIKENYGKIALNGNLDSCCGHMDETHFNDSNISYKVKALTN